MSRAEDSAELAALPAHLAERTRLLGGARAAAGEFVLYWMHHAVRGHENPALDVALTLAQRLALPLVVYQGLAGVHRYNNDRHHAFILQGARDVQRELRQRGIPYVFHLDPKARQPSALYRLAQRAAWLVVEDYPAPPFPAWTRRLASHCGAPTVAADACCIVPMRLQAQRFERAYAFRKANKAEYEQRVVQGWPEVDVAPVVRDFDGDLGIDALDLDRADIASLCASCAIDHGVPPVAHTVGGSRAGYARWDRFRSTGLADYARERNNAALAWPHGVSRLSPYLHHGHVSPLRIAREAARAGGEGAEKFLDELLVWRELAYNLCFHLDDPESLDCLPDWAQATLAAHADDPRPECIDVEMLARSCSGDALWDLAQTALRVHGELHNNLRMTWAKAILQWRPDPAAALRTLIDLNHRYALDGSDPNSYGGLLWALGLYDRPFDEQPVTGRLRSRSTSAHARRLDVERYRDRVSRPSNGKVLDIAVIGAGVAGLNAARTLHDQGHRVTVFDKSRGLGGRAATRRIGEIALDHGAQYFTADNPVFRRAVDAWCESGQVARWSARIAKIGPDGIVASPDERERFVGVPGMSALGRLLGAGLDIRRQVCVGMPRYGAGHWLLDDDRGAGLGRYDALIIAVPAPQAATLLRSSTPSLAARADSVRHSPTWSVMLALQGDDGPSFDGLFFDDDVLAWAACNGSKPGRVSNTWVLHATAAWSATHLSLDGTSIARQLIAAFCRHTGVDSTCVAHLSSHRWLYSLVERPLDVGALWDANRRLAACGDWCHGARIEGAYLSGLAAAGHLLRDLNLSGQVDSDRARDAVVLDAGAQQRVHAGVYGGDA